MVTDSEISMIFNVIAIAGSPRRHGNSETLLDWVSESMVETGNIKIEKIVVNECEIKPCLGCNACEKLNKCVIRDYFDILHDKLLDADCILISAPVYCLGLPSGLKALIDRAQVFRSRKYVLHLPVISPEREDKRLAAYLGVAGQDWDYVFDACTPSIKCFLHLIGIKNRDISYQFVRSVDEKGDIDLLEDAMNEAHLLGKRLVSELVKRNRVP